MAASCTEWGEIPPFLRAKYRLSVWKSWLKYVPNAVIAYIYTFYLLSFFFDLSPSARTKDQEELRQRRESERISGRGSQLPRGGPAS